MPGFQEVGTEKISVINLFVRQVVSEKLYSILRCIRQFSIQTCGLYMEGKSKN